MRQFNYDLKEMFHEKAESGQCYKSFAKWDLSFDREECIQELIAKRRIQDDDIEDGLTQAARAFLWTRLSEVIFKEEPIKFYSSQLRKKHMPPDIRMSLTKKKEDKDNQGVDGRQYVKISETCSLVVPDTFEKDKWDQKKKK